MRGAYAITVPWGQRIAWPKAGALTVMMDCYLYHKLECLYGQCPLM